MVRNSFSKAIALLTTFLCLALFFCYSPSWELVGVYKDCPWTNRLLFSFFHASFLHAALNCWCLLSICFLYDISLTNLVSSFFIAFATPGLFLDSTPTVGLSACCFALLAFVSFQVIRKRLFFSHIAAYIALGFIFPAVNGWIHLYTFCSALLLASFTFHFSCSK